MSSIIKGRGAYQQYLSAFQSLAVSSQESEEPSAPGLCSVSERGDVGSTSSLPKVSSTPGNLQQKLDENEEEIKWAESSAGMPTQMTRPGAERGQSVVATHPDTDSEEAQDSLPATVLTMVKIGDGSSEPSSGQKFSPEADPAAAVTGEEKSEESSGSSSLSWAQNMPDLDSIVPNTNTSDYSCLAGSLVSGEDREGTHREGTHREGTHMEGTLSSHGSMISLHVVEQTVAQVKDTLQGFVSGTLEDLQKFLSKIVSNQRDFGIYVSDKLNPSCQNKVICYRPQEEFGIVKTFLKQDNGCGVFLCEDYKSRHCFILKKVVKAHHRLIGVEFLAQHSQPFLPKVYGVYKEKDTISIFQEYIKGGTLNHVDWNLPKIRMLAEVLLSAVEYLHIRDLVHADIKLRNLMARDSSNPETLVLVDFESAKHPSYPLRKGGHTLAYLPPWHERFMDLEKYHPILKTVDLWAAACVIIFFLMPVDRSENEGVWSQVLKDIRKLCSLCSQDSRVGKHCQDCRKSFLGHVRVHGHRILEVHLGSLMDKPPTDPNWKALRDTLLYLTDTTNIDHKHVSTALRLIQGASRFYYQSAIEGDFDVNPRRL